MIAIFMKHPIANSFAVVVLIALIITWVTSIVLSMKDTGVETDRGWFAKLLPAFSVLGVPAALDLLQTEGATFLFAGFVLAVFILNFIIPVLHISRKSSHPLVTDWYTWTILISAIAGLIVAGYLTFVESTGTQIVCGPSSGCEEVQNSRYSVLFGVLPVGILGLAGYIGILASWMIWRFGPGSLRRLASLAIWAMCIFGVLFTIYLTFLEPFVIGATCMWCITSAALMIDLLLVSTPIAQKALAIPEE